MKVNYINIGTKAYPMCLTLKAARKMDERYGGLEHIDSAFTGKKTMEMLAEALFLLSALLEGGYDYAKASGQEADQPPKEEGLECLFGLDDLGGLQATVLSGMAASAPTVELEPDLKNGEATGSSPSRGTSTTPSKSA